MKLSQFSFFLPVLLSAVLVNTPAISSNKAPHSDRLSVRQTVESLYQNGMRNAQRHNDVYGQVRAVQKTLVSIRELRANSAVQPVADEKVMNLRCHQLQKLIAKGNTVETL